LSYIGFGPSAHSYDGKKRKWNIANNIKYVEAIAKQILPLEEETLSQNDRLNEYTMTSIRRSKGIEKNRLIQLGGESRLPEIQKMIQPYMESNKVVEDEKGWRLTNEGKFYADGIAAALFILD
jgi:oxygen-independent coproporphyrinogen-3 oxidase